VVIAKKGTRALAEDLCRWRLTATLQRIAREREINWLPEEVQVAEARADAVRRWSRAEVFYTWMEDAAVRREALATAGDDEVKAQVAKEWVEVAKVALQEASRAKRDLHRGSALAECPKGHRGRTKRARVSCTKKVNTQVNGVKRWYPKD